MYKNQAFFSLSRQMAEVAIPRKRYGTQLNSFHGQKNLSDLLRTPTETHGTFFRQPNYPPLTMGNDLDIWGTATNGTSLTEI